jgi:hypothetical protein
MKMNNTRGKTNKTSVKFLINILSLALFFGPAQGYADDAAANTAASLAAALQATNNPCVQQAGNTNTGPTSASCLAQTCSKLKDEANKAYNDMMTACGNGSLGGSADECFKKAVTCDVVSKDESFDSDAALNNAVNSILTSAGLSQAANLGTNKSGATSKCPQYTGADYKQRKKDLQDKINDLQKQMTDAQKDLSQQQKDTQKEIQDIQDDITKAKKEENEQKAKMDDDMREKIADFNKTQNDTKNQMRQNSLNMLQLRGKLVESQRKQAMDLLKLNDSATKAACVKAAQDSYSKFQSTANSMSMSFQQRSYNKQVVLSQYNDCLKTFDQQRQATIEQYRQEQQTLTQSISQAQSEQDDIQNSLNLAQTQLTDIQNQNTSQKQQLDQDLIQQMQSAQNKMQAAQTNFQQQQQIATQKNQQLQQQLNQATNDLNNLGPEPSSDATTTAKTASSIVSGKVQTLDAYVEKCCPPSGGPNCDSPSLRKASDAYHDAKGESRVGGSSSSTPPARQ